MASDGGFLPDGTVVCACGTIHPQASRLIASLREDIANVERELRGKRSRIASLQGEQMRKLSADPRYADACKVLRYWQMKCAPNTREPTNEARLRPTLARLKGTNGRDGYTVEELMRCVDGYTRFPFVVDARRSTTGQHSQRYVDPTLIFRNPGKVDQGIALAAEAEPPPAPVAPAPDQPRPSGEMGAAAVRFAEFGWHVFPVQPGDKRPLARSGGLLDATTDIERIVRFWTRRPDCNVAVRCGAPSGIVVLDVDPDKDGDASLRELERRYGALPKTPSVVTPRGGQHYYFRHPGVEVRNTEGFPGPGLDIRGDGGYVLVPPSVRADGRRYEPDEQDAPLSDMPVWLLQLLAQRARGKAADPAEWERIVTTGVKEGERNGQLLRLAGHLTSKGLSAGEVLGIVLMTNEKKCRPPLKDREVQSIVDSVGRMRAREAARKAA